MRIQLILAQVPEAFRAQVEPLIPGIVDAIHTAFSIATGATFLVGIVTALLAAFVVMVVMPAGRMGVREESSRTVPSVADHPEPAAH